MGAPADTSRHNHITAVAGDLTAAFSRCGRYACDLFRFNCRQRYQTGVKVEAFYLRCHSVDAIAVFEFVIIFFIRMQIDKIGYECCVVDLCYYSMIGTKQGVVTHSYVYILQAGRVGVVDLYFSRCLGIRNTFVS